MSAGEIGSSGDQGRCARIRIERVVYGGFGLGREIGSGTVNPLDGSAGSGPAALVPFVLPGELVDVLREPESREAGPQRIVEASPDRTAPGCPHFGECGGCHLQMAAYPEQLRLKREVLLESLHRAGVTNIPEPQVHASEPWGYRNRIRLRLRQVDGELRFGYTRRGEAQAFLPIRTCPIAAALLWRAAEIILATAAEQPTLLRWLHAAREVELLTNGDESRLQLTLLCPAPPKLPAKQIASGFSEAMTALKAVLPELAGAGAVEAAWSPLRFGRSLAEWASPGLAYAVHEEIYWVARGGFFQVNRFLLPTLVRLVCGERGGELAWDLFAGVGLFSRVLAHRFTRVTAVEAHCGSADELRRALGRLGAQHRARPQTALAFLQQAVVERERPGLIVLDPPRAGAGAEVCELLLRLSSRLGSAAELIYVSCDPVSLGRDLAILQRGYRLTALHLVDLFPQTYHQEAVVILAPKA